MASHIIAQNTRRLRREQDLTQEAAAEKIGITRVAYRNIETGKSIPRADTLRNIAAAFEVDIQALVAPVQRLENTRFRARRRMNTRESVIDAVAKRLHDFTALEKLLKSVVPPAEHKLAQVAQELRKARANNDRPQKAAELVRKHLDLGTKECIRDICGLLEDRAGIKVLSLARASEQFFGLSVAGNDVGPAIVVNTWDRITVERWIFTAAHELGHLMLHQGTYIIDEVEDDKAQEKEADLFASHFLMPPDLFWSEWRETEGMDFVDRVLKVKSIFRVSYRTVLYRLQESTPIGKGIWVFFQKAYQNRYGKTLLKGQEPQPLPPGYFQASRLPRLVRKAVEGGHITVSRGAEILGLQLREMRELMKHWLKAPSGAADGHPA
jgi:Zn-dependent peptidase ImmA (M78 family)/DNA-binding XRE family transcriptional regulator